MALGLNSTNTTIDFISSLITTFFSSDVPSPPGPKEPNNPKQAEPPSQHFNLLEWKQTLAIVSIIAITILIFLALLQTKIHKDCYQKFKKTQFVNTSGKTLFILFIIGLITFYINSIVFLHFIFYLDTLSEHIYANCLIFSMVPYRIGKLAMGMFFILRLHFVFKVSALKVNGWIISMLICASIIATILGCVAAILGPLKLIHFKPGQEGINPSLAIAYSSLAITILVDIIVMIFYIQRLMSVVVMRGEVIEVTKGATNQTHDQLQQIEIETRVEFDAKLVNTITKSTLLSVIGILSSFWLHLEMLVLAVESSSDGVLFRAIACLDGAINVIVMYLIFAFAKPYYEIGCKWCHIGMLNCCLCVTKTAVLRAKVTEV